MSDDEVTDLGGLRRKAHALRFTPQSRVQWMAPGQLWHTVIQVVISSVFGSFADKREIQVALDAHPQPLHWATFPPRTSPGLEGAAVGATYPAEYWLDYVADLGDGFDATFTVAWLLGHDLTLAGHDGPLRRGALLVMGGDEVYPTPSPRRYEDRSTYPYRAVPGDPGSHGLVALPGNHDWHDGLSSFLSTFAQGREFGSWKTGQSRSYFAVQLPHRWWLLGLDTQFGTYIDEPQLRFFEDLELREGDGVILCAATPTWVHTVSNHDPNAFNSLHYFDRQVVRPKGAQIRLWLTGDSHHYARYAERGAPAPHGRNMITCGLGGAYLSATHDLPGELHLPPAGSRLVARDQPPLAFDRAERTFPSASTSRRLERGLWRNILGRNPSFLAVAGAVQVLLFFLFAVTLRGHNRSGGVVHGVDVIRVRDHTAAFQHAWHIVLPVAILTLLALVFTALRWMWRSFTHASTKPHPPDPWRRRTMLAVELLLQFAIAALCLWASTFIPWAARMNDSVPLVGVGTWNALILSASAVLTGLFGGVLATYAFVLFLYCVSEHKIVDLRMSGQGIDDYKGFLRLRITENELTVYALTVEKVCRSWKTRADRWVTSSGPVTVTVPAPTPDKDPVNDVRLIDSVAITRVP
jgi:hypothetical protein